MKYHDYGCVMSIVEVPECFDVNECLAECHPITDKWGACYFDCRDGPALLVRSFARSHRRCIHQHCLRAFQSFCPTIILSGAVCVECVSMPATSEKEHLSIRIWRTRRQWHCECLHAVTHNLHVYYVAPFLSGSMLPIGVKVCSFPSHADLVVLHCRSHLLSCGFAVTTFESGRNQIGAPGGRSVDCLDNG